jgi:hypothetical protein
MNRLPSLHIDTSALRDFLVNSELTECKPKMITTTLSIAKRFLDESASKFMQPQMKMAAQKFTAGSDAHSNERNVSDKGTQQIMDLLGEVNDRLILGEENQTRAKGELESVINVILAN